MPQVKFIENTIFKIEGFKVIMKQLDKDVRSDKTLPSNYSKEKMSKGTYTVAEWRENCFKKQFPGYDVDVLDNEDQKVSGQTLLSNVRETYK